MKLSSLQEPTELQIEERQHSTLSAARMPTMEKEPQPVNATIGRMSSNSIEALKLNLPVNFFMPLVKVPANFMMIPFRRGNSMPTLPREGSRLSQFLSLMLFLHVKMG